MYQKLQFDNVSKITIRATGFFFKNRLFNFQSRTSRCPRITIFSAYVQVFTKLNLLITIIKLAHTAAEKIDSVMLFNPRKLIFKNCNKKFRRKNR
jgi:hypothetical protein